jgi:MYXO-CTERM domain-containing protein
MSVHGTGRALDVMIPTVKGAPNRAAGDKIANWLILNAQQIGVQLIIWNRTIWRSNGTNDASYGGPIPHLDHLHVELTEEAAAHSTKWFTTTDGEDAGDPDSGTDTTDTDSGTDTTDTDSGTDTDDDAGDTPEPDAAPPPPKDAGVKDSATPSSPDAEAPPPDTTTPPSGPETLPGTDSAGDEPGESNSLPTRPTRKTPTVADDEPPPDLSGCSAAPGSRAPLHTTFSGLALALGLGAWLRRRRR